MTERAGAEPAAAQGPLRRIATGGGWPAALTREWSESALASTNVFLTPEWAATWWERFGDDAPVVTVTERDETGSLTAIGVGYLADRGPLRVLRLVGHGPADELGPACAPGRRDEVARSFCRGIRDLDVCDVFVGDELPGDVAWIAASGGRVLSRIPSPSLPLEHGGWDAYLATRTSHFRGQLRRTERQLAEAGAEFRLTTDPATLDADFDAFLDLHGRRHGRVTPFSADRAAEFHRAFAHVALARGWLRLWLLEIAGRPVAGWYGFRFGGCDSHYQSARAPDRDLPVRSPGAALVAHTLRDAFAGGSREYRFLRGGEEYKYRWATEDRGLQTIAAGATRSGRLAALLAGRSLRDGRAHVIGRSAGRVVRRALIA